MERLKYFNTPEGQIHLRWSRLRSWFYVEIDQEPRSKSISRKDEIYFQTKVLEALKKLHKRAYTSPIVLQIDFRTSQKTPPGIHSLAKNYLDLLKVPVPGLKTKYKKILYNDDRQIKLLVVNYHLGRGPSIHIQAETLRSFICDLDLIRRIQSDDFEESEKFDDHDLSKARDEVREILNEDDLDENDDFTIRDLKKLETQKDLYIKKHGLKSYSTYRNFIICDIQRSYLKYRHLDINWLLSIFPSYYLKEKSKATGIKMFEDTAMIGRNFVSTLGIRLPSKPTKKEKSKEFKKEIKVVLEDFKKKYPVLFPIKSVLGITVLFLPPKDEFTDLDNLARKYIVSFVNEIVQPPRSYAETINIDDMTSESLKKHYLEELKRLPKDPQHSIVQYQVIEVPRLEADPDEGYIRLFFSEGMYESNLWSKIKHILNEWEDSLD